VLFLELFIDKKAKYKKQRVSNSVPQYGMLTRQNDVRDIKVLVLLLQGCSDTTLVSLVSNARFNYGSIIIYILLG